MPSTPSTSGSPRSEATYAQLLAALLDAREDAAGARFELVLTGAESAGEISSELVRELRYWQRAATHAVGEHVRTTLPGLLSSLESAAAQAVVDVEDAADAWRRASDPQRPPTPPQGDGLPVGISSGIQGGNGFHGVNAAAGADGLSDPRASQGGSEPVLRVGRRRPPEPSVEHGTNGPGADTRSDAASDSLHDVPAPTDLLEHRRRALVAGLLQAGEGD